MSYNILTKLLQHICKTYITFLHNFYAQDRLPWKSIFSLLILRIIDCTPLTALFLGVYLLGFLIFFVGVANKKFGQFVCDFLKKYTTTLTFNLLGNGLGSTIFTAMKLTNATTVQQLGALTGKVGVSGVIFLGADHGMSKLQLDTMSVHAIKNWYNHAHAGTPYSTMDLQTPPTKSIIDALIAKNAAPK